MLLSSGTTGGGTNGNIGGIPLSNNGNFFIATTQGHRSTITDSNNGGDDIGAQQPLPISRRYSSSPKPRSMRTQRGEHNSRPLTPRLLTPIVNYRNRNGGNGTTRRSFS